LCRNSEDNQNKVQVITLVANISWYWYQYQNAWKSC